MSNKTYILTENKLFHNSIRNGKTVQQMGFSDKVSLNDVVRFASRYRVAKSFKGILLEGFSEATMKGYNALFKLFLSWSAFEQLLKITGLKQVDEEIAHLFDSYRSKDLCDLIRKYDKNNAFYSFIISQVNNAHKAEIEKYFTEQELNSSYLASAIRHIFAHGQLTPHANNTKPKDVIKICDAISEFLLQIMDKEFTNRITKADILKS